MTSSEAAKLASLRARTDRDLVAIIDSALDRGLNLLHSQAAGAAAEASSRAKAEQAHSEAAKLLPLVYSLSDWERSWLEWKLAALRSALNGDSWERGRTAAA